jgi:23S rRNA (guanosine2251-2'-O)-methyltransferase
MDVIYGIHPVTEALKSRGRSFQYVAIAKDRMDPKVQRIVDDCRESGITVRFLPRDFLDRTANTNMHQGVIAVTSKKEYLDLDDIVDKKRGEHAFVVVLDGIEDPHNLGALLRSANGAGVDGVVIPDRRAVGVTGTAMKASAGAAEYVPIAKVTNIARSIEDLKQKYNVWTVGLDERGTQNYDEIDYNMNLALVLGAEGKGLHDLVRKKCDLLVKIPMAGEVASLNVSVAGGIVMYEVARQRRKKATETETAPEPSKKKGRR